MGKILHDCMSVFSNVKIYGGTQLYDSYIHNTITQVGSGIQADSTLLCATRPAGTYIYNALLFITLSPYACVKLITVTK